MPKNIILSILLIVSNTIHAQDYELPETRVHIERMHWKNNINNQQIKYWGNGNIKVEYELIDEKFKTRIDYYENGTVNRKCRIYQEYRTDTLSTFHYDTYEETMEISSGISDIAEGEFKKYYYLENSRIPYVQISGNYSNDLKVEEWVFIERSSKTIRRTVNFKENKLNGMFREFYPYE